MAGCVQVHWFLQASATKLWGQRGVCTARGVRNLGGIDHVIGCVCLEEGCVQDGRRGVALPRQCKCTHPGSGANERCGALESVGRGNLMDGRREEAREGASSTHGQDAPISAFCPITAGIMRRDAAAARRTCRMLCILCNSHVPTLGWYPRSRLPQAGSDRTSSCRDWHSYTLWGTTAGSQFSIQSIH